MGYKEQKLCRFFLMCVAVAFAFAFVFCGSVLTAQAKIENTSYSEDSQGVRTYYKNERDAIKAACDGKTIVMTNDWCILMKTQIDEGKKVTIDMNGHSMTTSSLMTHCPVLWVCNNAELNLISTAQPSTFTYTGLNSNGSESEQKVTAGGLVTGGHNGETAGGIVITDNAKCTLDNVAVAGNRGYAGGGVLIGKNSNLYMKNSTIQFNRCGGGGGGILVDGEDSHIHMENSSVDNNSSTDEGAGVYSKKDGTRIYMIKGSSISNNTYTTNGKGGGVYFENSYCGVYSSDKTAVIKDNSGKVGGGITFKGSYGGCSGITLQKNDADENGGAILNHGKDNTIEDCIITENVCGGGSEGGGVYNSAYRNVTLRGKVVVKDNTRGIDGSPDDLFLDSNWFFDAYILGGVSQGSSVGIRTGTTGTRMIGKNITTYFDGTYFMDLSDGYFVTHGDDHGGDLWQRRK